MWHPEPNGASAFFFANRALEKISGHLAQTTNRLTPPQRCGESAECGVSARMPPCENTPTAFTFQRDRLMTTRHAQNGLPPQSPPRKRITSQRIAVILPSTSSVLHFRSSAPAIQVTQRVPRPGRANTQIQNSLRVSSINHDGSIIDKAWGTAISCVRFSPLIKVRGLIVLVLGSVNQFVLHCFKSRNFILVLKYSNPSAATYAHCANIKIDTMYAHEAFSPPAEVARNCQRARLRPVPVGALLEAMQTCSLGQQSGGSIRRIGPEMRRLCYPQVEVKAMKTDAAFMLPLIMREYRDNSAYETWYF